MSRTAPALTVLAIVMHSAIEKMNRKCHIAFKLLPPFKLDNEYDAVRDYVFLNVYEASVKHFERLPVPVGGRDAPTTGVLHFQRMVLG